MSHLAFGRDLLKESMAHGLFLNLFAAVFALSQIFGRLSKIRRVLSTLAGTHRSPHLDDIPKLF